MKSIRCFSLLVAVLLSAALLFFLPGFMDTADPSPRKEEASRQFQGELSSIQPQDEAPAGAIEQGETNTGAMPKFSEIPYRRPDMTAITERYEALIAALEADKLSEDEAISQLEQVYSLYDDFYTMQAVADLRYYHDVTDSFYAVESDWFLENEPKMDQLFDELCSASANCALAETLDSRFWGDWVVDSYGGRTSSTLDPAFLALAQQENALQDALQLAEEVVHGAPRLVPVTVRQQFVNNGVVFFLPESQALFVGFVTGSSQAAQLDEPVGATANGGTHHDGAIGLQGLLNNLDGLKHGFRIGNGSAAEFEYLHRLQDKGR